MILALPTRRGYLLLLTAAGAWGIAHLHAGLTTALAAAVFLSLLGCSFLWAQCSVWFFAVRRREHRDGRFLEELSLPVEVENKMPFPRLSVLLAEPAPFAPGGTLFCPVPALKGREKITLPRKVVLGKRGIFPLSKITLCGGDPAGLFCRKRSFVIPDELVVRARYEELEDDDLFFSDSPVPGHEGRLLGHAGQGQEFYGVRPYRPGDEIRFIHWKGTAATGKLMIREFEASTADTAAILIDSEKSRVGLDDADNNFEYQIGLALSLCRKLAKFHCRLLFAAFDGQNENAELRSGGAGELTAVLEQFFLSFQPSRHSFAELLENAVDKIAPGSVVYALVMRAGKRELQMLELLLDRGCIVRVICADPAAFPENRSYRVRTPEPGSLPAGYAPSCDVRFADFSQSYSDLLSGRGE